MRRRSPLFVRYLVLHDTRTTCSCPNGQHTRENYIARICNRDYSSEYIQLLQRDSAEAARKKGK